MSDTNKDEKQIYNLFENLTNVRYVQSDLYSDTTKLYDDFYGKNNKERVKIETALENESTRPNIVNAEEYHKESTHLSFSFPDWTYGDWVNERNIWQRGLYSFGGEPNWFYFKVFFKFNTQHGLLGGLLNDNDVLESTNSAGKFLKLANYTYNNSKLIDRLAALKKFASILSRIQTHTPWFFKSVKGLDKASYTGIELGKEKSIELSTSGDSVDLRLTTLFELYKFACFDDINNREIIPENLRKFEMNVLIYSTPIALLHDAIYYEGKQEPFKSVIGNASIENSDKNDVDPKLAFKNTLSYKIYTFKNCEFTLPEIGSLMPNDVNNEAPFKIADGSILKITYDKCYVHTSNEIMGMMFGSDGFYYNLYNDGITVGGIFDNTLLNLRYKALKNLLNKGDKGSVTDLMAGDINKRIIYAGNELSNAIFDSQQNLNQRTMNRKIAAGESLLQFNVPIFSKGIRKLDNYLNGPITAAITASKNYLKNKLKDKLQDVLSDVTRRGRMFASLNSSNGIYNGGRKGDHIRESDSFKGKGSIGRRGNKETFKIPFIEDLQENYSKNKSLFNNVTLKQFERDNEIDTGSDKLNETIHDKGGYNNRNTNLNGSFDSFTAEVNENFNDPNYKNKFNNVSGNINKQTNNSLVLDDTTFDNANYEHRRVDFDKQEYKPFTDIATEKNNGNNGVTNKNTVRSTTFSKLSATASALKGA